MAVQTGGVSHFGKQKIEDKVKTGLYANTIMNWPVVE